MQIDLEELIGTEVISLEGGHIGYLDSIVFSEDQMIVMLDTQYKFKGDDAEVLPFKAITNENKEKTDDGEKRGKRTTPES